jgi:hypothetical protein
MTAPDPVEPDSALDAESDRPPDAGEDNRPAPGQRIVNLSWVCTGVFAASAVAADLLHAARGPAAVIAVVLFVVGVVTFFAAYAIAVARSRTDAIGIGGLFFLAGSAPRRVALRLRLSLAVQVVVAIGTSALRPFTSVAFGILVPMSGLGLMGLWGARYGAFPPRAPSDEEPKPEADRGAGEDRR